MEDPQDEPGRAEPNAEADQLAGPVGAGVERSLAASLSLAVIPVVILLLAALGAFVYGAAVFVHSAVDIARHPFPVGRQIGLFLLDIDLFLIGATLLISAVGFYELFIREIHVDRAIRMPAWLVMRDLNDLKGRVIAMIVMVLAVGFVELALDNQNGLQVLELGGGVALVILALTAFLRLTGHGLDKISSRPRR
ncbi:MAG TPA: YqhA family protein [Streptosporangiaceae bacterium]|nr:YqhA family protein [Streptosporangiaceae bacterium]